MGRAFSALVLAHSSLSSCCHGLTPSLPPRCSRRALLAPALTLAAGLPACAFENRLPPDELELKYKTPRTPGPKPTDIGPRPGGGLKACVDGKP